MGIITDLVRNVFAVRGIIINDNGNPVLVKLKVPRAG